MRDVQPGGVLTEVERFTVLLDFIKLSLEDGCVTESYTAGLDEFFRGFHCGERTFLETF